MSKPPPFSPGIGDEVEYLCDSVTESVSLSVMAPFFDNDRGIVPEGSHIITALYWWPVTVIAESEEEPDRVRIRYMSYGDNWLHWVHKSRLRPVQAPDEGYVPSPMTLRCC
eukprot:m.23339 g.23339  ORF g.23339 m.23339 type:complete len:111 (-) comp7138_c0_seq1:459-791(-)